MKLADVGREQRHRLLQRGAKGVIGGLGENVRPRRDQVRADAERRAGFELALDGHSRFIDLARFSEFFELLVNQCGQRSGGGVMEMLEDDFHGSPTLRTPCGFDKDTFSHLP